MSKSVGNTILLSDAAETIMKKTKSAVTDPQKIRKGDPGHPDICLIFAYHNKFNVPEVSEIRRGCESGSLGCVECKTKCATRISEGLAPIREKRRQYESRMNEVESILLEGENKARLVAQGTMAEVHAAMGIG